MGEIPGIPVILSDFLDVPFQNVVDWPALTSNSQRESLGVYARGVVVLPLARKERKSYWELDLLRLSASSGPRTRLAPSF